MLLSGGLVLVVFLGVMGAVLDNAFRLSAEQSESERLLLHIYALIAASDEVDVGDAASIYLPEELQEPHFNHAGSGLSGLVLNDEGEEIWRSQSAVSMSLSPGEVELIGQDSAGESNFGELAATDTHDKLFYLGYRVIWQSGGEEAGYLYIAMQDSGPYQNSVTAFRNNLWGWLIAGVVVLVGLQAAIMYWGLLPVTALEGDLKSIENGDQEYLGGEYPREIAGVTRSLNLLLADERRQREQYRTTLADLAHSMKTPLSILKNEAARPELSEVTSGALNEQVDRMNDIVSYQLEKAVAASSLLYGASVDVQGVVEKLIDALSRVYKDKGITIESDVDAAVFAGDERDIYELMGNLLDNACKYGASSVKLTVQGRDRQLFIRVEDDGAGIPDRDRNRVLERGMRLDTREAGQGIGLAVIAEIVERYHGTIEIVDSNLGGAAIEVRIG